MNTKKPYLNASVLTPVGILVVLIGYLYEALRMSSIIKQSLPSESFFPFLIFLLGFPVGIFLLITGVRETKKKIVSQPDVPEVSPEISENEGSAKIFIKPSQKPFYITVLTVIFVVLFKYLGYTISAPIYVFFFQLIYDDKFGNYGKKIITSLIITALVYALYVGFFNILFPEVWK